MQGANHINGCIYARGQLHSWMHLCKGPKPIDIEYITLSNVSGRAGFGADICIFSIRLVGFVPFYRAKAQE